MPEISRVNHLVKSGREKTLTMSRPVGRTASAPAGCCSSTPETTRTPRTCQIVEETRCLIGHAPGGRRLAGTAGSPVRRPTAARTTADSHGLSNPAVP